MPPLFSFGHSSRHRPTSSRPRRRQTTCRFACRFSYTARCFRRYLLCVCLLSQLSVSKSRPGARMGNRPPLLALSFPQPASVSVFVCGCCCPTTSGIYLFMHDFIDDFRQEGLFPFTAAHVSWTHYPASPPLGPAVVHPSGRGSCLQRTGVGATVRHAFGLRARSFLKCETPGKARSSFISSSPNETRKHRPNMFKSGAYLSAKRHSYPGWPARPCRRPRVSFSGRG